MEPSAFDLEAFWDALFSEDAARIAVAWASLSGVEQKPVCEHLQRIVDDEERSAAQRLAAGVALRVVAGKK